MTSEIKVKVEFGGGLELLFSNERVHDLSLPSTLEDGKPTSVDFLIHYLRDNLLKEREELFLDKDTVYVLGTGFAITSNQSLQTTRNTGPHKRYGLGT